MVSWANNMVCVVHEFLVERNPNLPWICKQYIFNDLHELVSFFFSIARELPMKRPFCLSLHYFLSLIFSEFLGVSLKNMSVTPC